MQIIFLLALPLLMYFLLIRPQQRKLKEQRELLAAVQEGDEIITTGGIYGYVNAVEEDTIWLEIAEGVEIRIVKGGVMRRIPADESTAEGPDALLESFDAESETGPSSDKALPPDTSINGAGPADPTTGKVEDTPKAGPEADR
jgi:preprotein translocase subunit YajC